MSGNINILLNSLQHLYETDEQKTQYLPNISEISFFVSLLLKHNPNTRRLLRRLNPLLLSLQTNIENIDYLISQTEDQILSVLTSDCQTNPTNIPIILQKSRLNSSHPSLCSILPYFLKLLYIYEFGQDTVPNSYQIFSNWIFRFLAKLGISSTRFSNCLLKKYICGSPELSFEDCIVDVPLISTFFDYFLIERNLWFFSKVSQISEVVLKKTKIGRTGLNLTVSKTKPEFSNDKQALPEMTRFKFSGGCLDLENNEGYRDDYLILVGKHQLCDIKLPENDPDTEDVSCVIFPCYRYWKIVDVSQSSYPKVGVKLNVGEPYFVEPGCLVSFGKNCTLIVVDILFDENEFGVFFTTLRFMFVKGPYVNELKEFRANLTENLENHDFLVGRGSFGRNTSLFIPERYGLGREHACFRYTEKGWSLIDLGSLRGSFIHLKKGIDQGKNFSSISNLLSNSQESSTINICDYIFYISRDQEV